MAPWSTHILLLTAPPKDFTDQQQDVAHFGGPSTSMQTEIMHFPGFLIVTELGHLSKDTQGHPWLGTATATAEQHLAMQPQALSAEPFSLSPDKVFCL